MFFNIIKIDHQGNLVPGAKFNLIDSNEDVLELITDENGKITIRIERLKNYIIKEIGLDNKIYFIYVNKYGYVYVNGCNRNQLIIS